MSDEGIYVVRTDDPLGEWDEPVLVLEGKGLIDPCPIWDEDGRAYIIHGYAKSRIGFKSILGLFEISSDGMKVISEDRFIFDGNDPAHPAVTIEGPKVYKMEGYYYIWAPAGGVRQGYQVVLRASEISGPYEIKTVLHQGGTVINGPHQGGLVSTPDGKEYFLHFQDRGLYGRICHLQPVTWNGAWPIVGVNPNEDGVGEPVYELEKPVITGEEPVYLEASDDFPTGEPGLQWQWSGDHDSCFYGIPTDEEDMITGGLRLFCQNPSGDEKPVLWRSANVLTQKLIYPSFKARAVMDASGLLEGDRAGVCMMGGQYVAAFVQRDDDGEYYVRTIHSEGDDDDKTEVVDLSVPLKQIASENGYSVDFALKNIRWIMTFTGETSHFSNVSNDPGVEDMKFRVYLSFDEIQKFNTNGDAPEAVYIDLGIEFTPSDHTWVGAKIGLFALSGGYLREDGGYADFRCFDCNPE